MAPRGEPTQRSRSSEADQRRLREIEDALCSIQSDAADRLAGVMGPLAAVLKASASLAYSLVPTSSGLAFDFWEGSGREALRFGQVFAPFVASNRRAWAGIRYDPLRPAPDQRNVVLPHLAGEGTAADLERYYARIPETLGAMQQLGLGGDQLRVLICRGTALLGWVGAFREEPFGEREASLLRMLVPALRRRLRLQARLGPAALGAAGLERVLEAVPAAAFLVGPPARPLLANAAGRARLQATPGPVRQELALALAGHSRRYDALAVRTRGLPGHSLLVERFPPPDLGLAADRLAQRLGLPARKAEVLRRIVAGEANKEIACGLGISVTGVELHVTGILRRAGCESRAQLAALARKEPP